MTLAAPGVSVVADKCVGDSCRWNAMSESSAARNEAERTNDMATT